MRRKSRNHVGLGVRIAGRPLVRLTLVPLAAFGPERTVSHYRQYGEVFFKPLFGVVADAVRWRARPDGRTRRQSGESRGARAPD